MINKVAIIGAGAIGAYIIWGTNNNVTVIAKGARKEKLEKQGININDQHYTLNVKTPEEAGSFDLVLICTKYDGLDEAISYLPVLIHENSIVLSLLNGVDSEEKIMNAIGCENVLYSLMRIASKREGNNITFNPELIADLFFGSVNKNDEKIDILVEYFKKTRIKYHVVDNILEDIWTKYASNIANNLPQAILQVPAKFYTDSEHGPFISKKLWHEVYLVAQAKGIHISEFVVLWKNVVPKSSKFSTLQDIEAKRHTEIEMFLGVLIRYANELSIDVPYSEYTYHLIKALEEKNDGLFDLKKEDYYI